jgi:hypothetical protein
MSVTVPDDEIEAPEATRIAAERWFGEEFRRTSLTAEEKQRLDTWEPRTRPYFGPLTGLPVNLLPRERVPPPPEIEALLKRADENDRLLEKAWSRLCWLLAEGRLVGYVCREADGKTEAAEPIYWTTDPPKRARFDGQCFFMPSEGGHYVQVRPRMKRVDFELVLEGKTVPARKVISSGAAPAGYAAGRKPNAQHDEFWIELCWLVINGSSSGEDLAALTEQMTQWASVNMKRPYDEGTVRRKVSGLLKRLGSSDN